MAAMDDFFQLDMPSHIWTQVTTNHTKPLGRCCSSLTAISENMLVLHAGASKLGYGHRDTWIIDLSSQARREYTSNQDDLRACHTGSLGVNKSVIVIGGLIQSSLQAHRSTFHVMLEPKSLQQLAMRIIYTNQNVLSWKCLPSKLVAQLGLVEKKEMTT